MIETPPEAIAAPAPRSHRPPSMPKDSRVTNELPEQSGSSQDPLPHRLVSQFSSSVSYDPTRRYGLRPCTRTVGRFDHQTCYLEGRHATGSEASINTGYAALADNHW
jgi:hypothetical protein